MCSRQQAAAGLLGGASIGLLVLGRLRMHCGTRLSPASASSIDYPALALASPLTSCYPIASSGSWRRTKLRLPANLPPTHVGAIVRLMYHVRATLRMGTFRSNLRLQVRAAIRSGAGQVVGPCGASLLDSGAQPHDLRASHGWIRALNVFNHPLQVPLHIVVPRQAAAMGNAAAAAPAAPAGQAEGQPPFLAEPPPFWKPQNVQEPVGLAVWGAPPPSREALRAGALLLLLFATAAAGAGAAAAAASGTVHSGNHHFMCPPHCRRYLLFEEHLKHSALSVVCVILSFVRMVGWPCPTSATPACHPCSSYA